MTQAEIEAVLQAAFGQCEAEGFPLTSQQRQILLQHLMDLLQNRSASSASDVDSDSDASNPLAELTPEQRRAFLQFVREHDNQTRSWKVQLLDDWLQGRESGAIQFIREIYGPQWLEQVQPAHIAEYAEEAVSLQVGDRIEICNSLWEWVQDNGPCQREWVVCTVVGLSEAPENMPMVPHSYRGFTSCMVRFDNGMEYEIQGVYEWNRYNWRWPEG